MIGKLLISISYSILEPPAQHVLVKIIFAGYTSPDFTIFIENILLTLIVTGLTNGLAST